MRDIKFLVWDKKDKRFIEWWELVFLLYPWSEIDWEVSINEQYYHNTDNNWDYDNNRFELMEYTWLKDKNWKEIYEWYFLKQFWDILLIKSIPWWFIVEKLDWINKNLTLFPSYLIDCEIIWNIYMNPEFLNTNNKS